MSPMSRNMWIDENKTHLGNPNQNYRAAYECAEPKIHAAFRNMPYVSGENDLGPPDFFLAAISSIAEKMDQHILTKEQETSEVWQAAKKVFPNIKLEAPSHTSAAVSLAPETPLAATPTAAAPVAATTSTDPSPPPPPAEPLSPVVTAPAASPPPAPIDPVLANLSPLFRKGLADRTSWEQWISSQTGDFKAGAEFRAGQRNLPKPGTCHQQSEAFQFGCMAAQEKLATIDVLRKSELDYKAGWNAFGKSAGPAGL